MGILTCIVAAEDDEVPAVAESASPTVEWSGIECQGIDTMQVVTLHCLLCHEAFDEALARYEPLFVTEEDRVILRLADELVGRLASLDEEAIETLAAELAASESFESIGWSDESVNNLLLDLADLAQLADAQGQALLVRIQPVMR